MNQDSREIVLLKKSTSWWVDIKSAFLEGGYGQLYCLKMKFTANVVLSDERINVFFLRLKTKQGN